MLYWLESPELRRRCHARLNKSEQRHFLAQVICTFKQGRQTRPANKAGKQGRQTRPANKAGKQGRQTRPANKAGLPTAVPRRSSFVPPASTSSLPRSCSETPPTDLGRSERQRRGCADSGRSRGGARTTGVYPLPTFAPTHEDETPALSRFPDATYAACAASPIRAGHSYV